jgi:hypothetical protein
MMSIHSNNNVWIESNYNSTHNVAVPYFANTVTNNGSDDTSVASETVQSTEVPTRFETQQRHQSDQTDASTQDTSHSAATLSCPR